MDAPVEFHSRNGGHGKSGFGEAEAVGLLDVQRLVEKLVQVKEERGVIDDERGTRLTGLFVRLDVLLAGEGDDGNVAGSGVAPQRGDGVADGFVTRLQIDEDEHGRLAFRRGLQVRRCRHGLHTIAQILQPVDQLATGQEFLVEQQRERSLHRRKSGTAHLKLQKTFRLHPFFDIRDVRIKVA